MTIATPLSVSGRWIVDAHGNRVKLAGVNWAGAHQDAMTPGGLDYRQRDEIAAQIAEWGFNSVRFPFALETVTSTTAVAPSGLAANPDLVGSTPWQVYSACVQALTGAGLMVIPNCHLLSPGWCCANDDQNGLWWNATWPSSAFAQDWLTVAGTFADNPLVIGYDLKNEPRQATIGGTTYHPSWGDGNPETDFCQLYTATATSIQAVDRDALFFCEGLDYAANLKGVKTKPVTPGAGNCVVYSMHDYSWFHPAGQSRADYITAIDDAGGFLMTGGTAPVWIGEFGTANDSLTAVGATTTARPPGSPEAQLGAWFSNFLAWAGQTDADWCLWLLDGTMCLGTTPETNQLQCALGDRNGYGLFAQDWVGVSNPALLKALQSIVPPTTGPGVQAKKDPPATP
jgi:endoglucanase